MCTSNDYCRQEIREAKKAQKWVVLHDEEPDFSSVTVTRRFSGRLTKARYKVIDRYCRKNSWRSRCGHEYDCCGCVFMESMSFTYKHNQVIIYKTQHRNY